MVNTLAPPVSFENSPSPGNFASSAIMLDGITAAPYEGLWIPSRFTRNASIEISGTFSTLAVGLYGTNQISPLNAYTVTLGGSVANGDILSIVFNCGAILGGSRTVAYTVSGTPTLTAIAASIAALISADAVLSPLGFTASSASAVITISFPTAPANNPVGSFSSPPPTLSTILSASSTGSETMTIATSTSGVSFANATSNGFTQLPGPMRWVKARLTTLTGGSANVSAFFAGIT